MRGHSSVAVLGIALASAWVSACGSAHDALPTLGSTGGVAIHGTVESDGAASSADVSALAAQSGGLRVSVQGTSLSTTTDKQGRFTLSSVPAGQVTLRFQGSGVDARLTLGGLIDGQVLTIAVAVSGSSAQLLSTKGDRSDDDIEFAGTVESVTPPSLMVEGITVVTDAETEIKRGVEEIALADIAVGETVKVEGRRLPDSTVHAREIEVLGDGTGAGAEVEFTGIIESITPPTLVVAGKTVMTDSITKFKGQGKTDSLSDFSVGDTVKVEGTLNTTSTIILATEIQRLSEADDEEDEDDEDEDEEEDEDEDDEDDEDEDEDNSGSGS